MTPAQAVSLTRQLLNANGLGHIPVSLHKKVKALGTCYFRGEHAVEIKLSEHAIRLNPDEKIRTVILHEIAHALAGASAGHGPVWKAHARRLGIAGDRCEEAIMPEGNVHAICTTCRITVARRHRMPRKTTYCCGKCRGPIIWRRVG